ncbi:glucose-1-phosphate cytidylyltransferase [Roseovarius sp. EL26]|uniref:glucose-1-phosphate cytidylyltransferase n=1 Tax=Roseovarius sp. EL26 TaxID=2126672 RepID=UPI000EA1344E|nr:glucose-1-phosphate cytidylyltransferase [Roseovarius sp. EL26]
MKTVILCGGFGTRIRNVADDIPKPMVPIGDKPLIWHIMKYYAHFGMSDFILCAGYKGSKIKDYFLSYDRQFGDCEVILGRSREAQVQTKHDELGWKVTIADTGLNTMTGGRVQKIKKYVADDDHFFLTYGDGLSDVDLNALLTFHKSHGKALTVTGVRPPGRFGELTANDAGLLSGFNEKPQASGGRISGGYFVCSRRIFDFLTDDESLVFEQEPMKQLVAEEELMMYRHDGFWQCMDTYRDWKFLQSLLESGDATWKMW